MAVRGVLLDLEGVFSPAMAAVAVLRREGLTRVHLAALEYAAGTTARVLGKPDRAFFDMALASIGLAAGEVVMVGDDIDADIGGAQSAGLRAVQVETGKYSARDRDHRSITPDARIATIADLPDLLASMG